MTHWKLTLAYDGTPYNGWQVQPGLPTIQGFLADAVRRTVGEQVLPQGSGRTDAGVHALAQVASFSLAAPIPPANLHRALNRCLPPSIRILTAEIVPPHFHARHSALCKTYEYRIFPLAATPKDLARHPRQLDVDRQEVSTSSAQISSSDDCICPPTLAPFVWPCPWPLSLDALNQVAGHVLGTHDFTTFAAADPDLTTRMATEQGAPHLGVPGEFARRGERLDSEMWVGSPPTIRTITQSHWHLQDNLFVYRVTANGFLHHMVRNLVGTFVLCGAQRLSPNAIPTLLAARNRAAAGPTAPATGLFLVNVEYPDLQPSLTEQQPTIRP